MIIDPMVGRAAAAAAAPVQGPPTATTPDVKAGPADQADNQQRFQEAVGRPSPEEGVSPAAVEPAQPATAPQPTPQAELVAPAEPADRLGDAILRSIDRAHQVYEQNLDRIDHEIGKAGADPTSMRDLMRLQFDVMKFGLYQETTSKVADKAAQGVQTVLKNQ
jgi:hypothetical protein